MADRPRSDGLSTEPGSPSDSGEAGTLVTAGPGHAARIATAASLLLELLESDPGYRAQWAAQETRRRPSVNLSAVARVLQRRLWDTGQLDDDADLSARQVGRLRDVVSRALSGQVLASRTVQLFIEAFGMSVAHASDLWSAFTGAPLGRLVVVPQPDAMPLHPTHPPTFHAVSCHERHTLGPEGLPTEHETSLVLRAVKENFERYSYRFDTDAAAVEVLRGGTAGPVYQTPRRGVYAVDILPDHPVAVNNTHTLIYRTTFRYNSAPPAEFRRGAPRRIDNLMLSLQFDPLRLPRKVCWALWDSLDDHVPSHSEQVGLDGQHSVQRFLDSLEGHLAGFHWSF